MDAGPDQAGDRYYSGLDLGTRVDPSGLATLRRRLVADPQRPGRLLPHFVLRGLRRFPLGALYTEVCAEVTRIFSGPPLAGSVLGVDRSGVGDGVTEILTGMRPRALLRTVVITGGQGVSQDGADYALGKVQLIGAVTAALEAGRLVIPDNLPDAETLVKEMMAFKAKVTATGHETLEAWRERTDHDDLVIATAIGVWLGSQDVNTGRPVAYSGQGRPPGFEGALYGRGFGAAAAGSWRPPGAAGLPGGLPPLEPGE